ncbi:MAG: cupredoxin domain-containing protein [Betaproteobacteria bacterium]
MKKVKESQSKGSTAYLVAAFVIAFSVLLIIPMWAAYGGLFPKESGGHSHGAGESVSASGFEEKTARFIEEHRLPDGSVRADHDKPIYVLATQYTFTPNTIRLAAGEQYELQMLSADVVHAFSILMGNTSYNAVVMPKMVTALKLKPTKPGTYLVVCNEYCGIGHDYMYFSVIVEEAQKEGHHEMSEEQHEEMLREQREKSSTKPKDSEHGEHRHGK